MIRRKISLESHSPDWPFLVVILTLLSFGVLMVYDSSVVTAANVFGGKYYFLLLQLFWSLVGLIAFVFFSLFDYRQLSHLAKPLLIVSLVFLVLVVLPTPFTKAIYGAKRWFYINPDPLPLLPFFGRLGFQPTEPAKFSLVVFLSALFSTRPKNYLLIFGVVMLTFLFLVGIQPDFGTTLVLGGIGLISFFIAGESMSYFLVSFPLLLLGSFVYILISPYRRERLLTFLFPDSNKSLTSGYQINQILIALGSGGLFGVGLGQSRQKYGFIPEVQTDSIFAIVGEELGLAGTALLIGLFLMLVWRGFKIAASCQDKFGRNLVVGFMSWFALQVLINLSSMTHLIPLTGIPLPLISYGGSAAIFMLAGLGVVFNVSRYSKRSNSYGGR
jgi:cell division protein FtsW